jgi:hypothetical protein
MTTACYGPFPLTKAIYNWNGTLKGNNSTATKWIVEGVFLIMLVVPVYGATLFIDAVALNSIEFWTGKPVKIGKSEEGTVVALADGTTASFSMSAEGHAARVRYTRDGTILRTVDIVRDGETFRVLDADGKELYAATRDATGALQITDQDCRLLGNVTSAWVQEASAQLGAQHHWPDNRDAS